VRASGAGEGAAVRIAGARLDRDPVALFGRYLDLTPLRHRRRGLVRCCFHQDRTGSLSIDLDKGVFNCFGCGEHGGVRRFAELVGESTPAAARLTRPESPLHAAMRRAAQQAHREGQQAAEWAPWMHSAEFVRRSTRLVDQARADATTLGPHDPRTWPLLELTAQAERDLLAFEAELDAILASGRIA
jgi:hypothetical protein